MVKKILLLFLILKCCLNGSAQLYQVGHLQKTFTDPSRSNRSIATEIYYPAITSGNNMPMSMGRFPVIAFGHGFVMSTSAYDVIWNYLVPRGFILVLPNTEGSLSPSHLNFAKDLAFVLQAMKTEGQNPNSFFYGSISEKTAVMGHSMGGGASFLAAQSDSSINAMVTLAAAETNPSAIAAASFIHIPTLTLAGLNDCVAPPSQHQLPMYDSLSSPCKTYIAIIGASHCQFASSNAFCSFGESTCSPQATISAVNQQNILLSEMSPWLQFYLQDSCSAANGFQQTLINNNAIQSNQNCTLVCVCNPVSIANHPSSLTVNQGDDAFFYVQATGNNLQFQWQFNRNNGLGFVNIQGATNDTLFLHQVTDSMNNYQYRVIVSNSCLSTAITNPATLYVQMVSPQTQPITIGPNPTYSQITINAPDGLDNACILIYNQFGQIVKKQGSVSGTSFIIDSKQMSSGYYFVKVIQNNKVIKIQKVFFANK